MMKALKFIFVSLFLMLFAINVQAQNKENISAIWDTLLEIEWEFKYSKVYETDIPFPIFSEKTKALDGKEIKIKGFLLPVDTEDKSLVLSAYPFSSCFFCGGAGPESVISIKMKRPRKFNMDEVAFKGTLKLNNTDEGLIYILEDAEEYLDDL